MILHCLTPNWKKNYCCFGLEKTIFTLRFQHSLFSPFRDFISSLFVFTITKCGSYAKKKPFFFISVENEQAQRKEKNQIIDLFWVRSALMIIFKRKSAWFTFYTWIQNYNNFQIYTLCYNKYEIEHNLCSAKIVNAMIMASIPHLFFIRVMLYFMSMQNCWEQQLFPSKKKHFVDDNFRSEITLNYYMWKLHFRCKSSRNYYLTVHRFYATLATRAQFSVVKSNDLIWCWSHNNVQFSLK